MENIGLRMHRSTLDNLPPVLLPEGFRFRTYQHGDREVWVQLYGAAEAYAKITPELFDREFYGDEAALSGRMIFLFDAHGAAIGTSTAWYDDIDRRPELGRVHWVAIHPDFQGRGLGRALLAETLRVLHQLGHSAAYLMTSSARIPALSLYLSCSFVPQIESDEQQHGWQQAAEKLQPEFQVIVRQALAEYSGV